MDLNILPRLMRTLEAHAFQRGYAYRYGGDEYAMLLQNTTQEEATSYLNELRVKIETLRFPRTKSDLRITASIGFVAVIPNCHLTGLEIESAAARAKQHAKQSGKNRLASFDDPWFESLRAFS